MRPERRTIWVGVAVLTLVGSARAEDRAALDHFEAKVRPLLVEHCARCHGAEKQKGGLRLDSAEALARGGETGPVVVPGDPDQSRLIEAVQYADDLRMPPKGKLAESEVAALRAWVRNGAVWPSAKDQPGTADLQPDRRAIVTEEDRAFWAFRPVVDPAPPTVRDRAWIESPIDRFILARLEDAGLRPSPAADRRTLIRRLTFDLTGLPPTPEAVAAFLADDRPDAYDQLVDRLLASPAYGERWGRRWLDLARYSDSNGMDENVAYANAWRYRDYVVASFNADMPYDRFLKEQIAGDLLPAADESARHAAITGTGFLVLGPKMLAEDDPVKMEMDIVDEQVDTVGKVFLGLTLGCARCHDHKFDPIPTHDYYAMAGIFKSTKSMANHKVVAMWHERALADAERRAALEAHNARKVAAEAAVKAATARARKALNAEATTRVADYLLAAKVAIETGQPVAEVSRERNLQPKFLERWVKTLTLAKDDPGSVFRDWLERGDPELAAEYQRRFDRAAGPSGTTDLAAFRKVLDDPEGPLSAPRKNAEEFYPAEAADRLESAKAEVKSLEESAPAIPEAMAVEEGTAADLKIHLRGSHLTLGEVAPRGFPRVLAPRDAEAVPDLPTGSSGRRELAEWMARPDHPLTARVFVNRIWLGHFGQGIVRTPDNFGRLGEPPTHPELLDWLASRFVESGWSIKALHRLIVRSSTYRMGGRWDEQAAEADPENRLRWRFDRRRLEAEAIRDAILAVSGGLDRAMGSTRLNVKNHAYVNTTGATQRAALYDAGVRSVYLPVIRSGLYPVFQAFDFADPSVSTGMRDPTTVPSQALFLLNDGLVLRASSAWARRLLDRVDLDDAGRVQL
ncbi:MAG: PSD1 and planctomycete cytochrome C domain-containing protein, partial [Isosphaeraceae bacterium]